LKGGVIYAEERGVGALIVAVCGYFLWLKGVQNKGRKILWRGKREKIFVVCYQ
jgi:hypothetical protein